MEPADMKQKLENMLAAGHDSALLRFSLGDLLFKEGDLRGAIHHLAQAVAQEPDYSAAWKLYGRALAADGDPAKAVETLDRGIAVAEQQGDRQAVKEMQVFRKRARKQL